MKSRLRKEKILERLAQIIEEKQLNDEKIVSSIKNLKQFKQAKKILLYMPIKGEVDLTSLLSGENSSKIFAIPKVKKTSFDAFVIENHHETTVGAFNIKEPAANSKKISPDELDLILIPGVCFSEDGHRIGFGKGFYDRYLKKTKAYKIGIAYEFQMVKNVPWHEHDVPMDMIITEKRTIKIK